MRWEQGKTSGLTLLELIVVVSVILIVAALLIPFGQRMRKSADLAQCTSNLRQLGAVFYLYAADNAGRFPFVVGDSEAPTKDERDGNGKQWDSELIPYLGLDLETFSRPTIFYCRRSSHYIPSAPGRSQSYTYNTNVGDNIDGTGHIATAGDRSTVVLLADFEHPFSTETESLSHTILGGRNNMLVFRPGKGQYRWFAYRHEERVNLLFMDGHVAPRRRIVKVGADDVKELPPEYVRWKAGGDLTSE